MTVAVYVNAPDCSCGHGQSAHHYPGAPVGCSQCTTCKRYDGVIETLGVGRSPDHIYPAVYDDRGYLILPPELLHDTSLDDAKTILNSIIADVIKAFGGQ